MSTTLYTEQDNGNLKLVAEVEGIDNPALAADALLDNSPRIKDREFIAVVGSIDDEEGAVVTRVTIEDDEPVNPRRTIRIGAAPKAKRTTTRRAAKPPVEESVEEPVAPKPKQRRQTRKPAAKAAAKPAAAKPAAKRSTRKPASKPAPKAGAKKASPFKTKPEDD